MDKDIAKVLFSEEQLKKRIAELGKQLSEDYRDHEADDGLHSQRRGSCFIRISCARWTSH